MKVLSSACALFVVLSSSAVWACSCAPPPPPKKSLAVSAAVFAGKVKTIERNGRLLKVTLEISRTWKGTKGKTVVVTTAASGAACGFGFKKGSSYLVYCYKPRGKGAKPVALVVSLCSRTRPLERAKEDLKELGPGKKP